MELTRRRLVAASAVSLGGFAGWSVLDGDSSTSTREFETYASTTAAFGSDDGTFVIEANGAGTSE